ncbi:MAG: hypothetical protein J6Y26_05290, partial [Lachnospiraceae bacterium]|nr:hypothetical protein [Lachnospiraceae bacterium]
TNFLVDNIDKVAPVAPVASADVTRATNGDVLVSAQFSDDSVMKEYSLDGATWQAYTAAVKFTDNGSVFFRSADEAGNISEVASYAVSNIDKVAPEKPTAAADVTAATNGDVHVLASFSADSVVKEYSLDGQTWQVYMGAVTLTENGSVFFRGTDAAGNVSEVTSYSVTNIDKVAPVKPAVTADITDPTNTDVLVSAQFSDDSVKKEYSLDGQTWRSYSTAIRFAENGTVSFRGTDAAGNVSAVASYTVANINKVAPDKPVATIDVTAPTNTAVHVSAVFNDNSVSNEYSLNGTDWLAYTGSIEFTENGKVYFRSTDIAGNISEVTAYEVTNIDKIAPVAPVASADVTAATNGKVLVSALFSDDSAVKEYSLDGQTWKTYGEAVVFTDNGSVMFRGTDEAGNISEVTAYEVTNIDKVAPVRPTASADVTTATNGDVLVSAVFSEDSVVKEYSLDGTVWQAYTDAVKFTGNGSVFFRGTDAAGNVSEVASYVVSNIDKVAPVKPTASADVTTATNGDVLVSAVFSEDSVVKEYSLDGQTWKAYATAIQFMVNGTAYFRAKDAAGNISEVASYTVGNINKVAPDKPVAMIDVTAPTNTAVHVSAIFNENSVLNEYSLNGTEWLAYTGSIELTENGTVYLRSTDEAGNVSEVTSFHVSNIDKVAPVKPMAFADVTTATNGDVFVSAQFSTDSLVREYSFDGQTWKNYTDAVKFMENGTVYFRGADAAGNISEVISYAVTNIDKSGTEKPVATASITTPTNSNVTVSAVFSEDAVKKEYSMDGQTWQNYADAILFTGNGTVYFRGTDAAGNVSDITEYAVTNIDKVAPEKPEASADITTTTNGNVLVSAQFSEDSVTKEYSLDGQTWQAYTDAIVFTENGTVYFRSTDEAGNVSEVASYEITNIETVIPDTVKPTVSNIAADITAPTNQDVVVTAEFADDVSLTSSLYRIGETGEWLTYVDGVTVFENATVYFKAVDASGNESDVVSYAVTNIDKVAPTVPVASADMTAPTNGNVTVIAQFSEDSVIREYSLDGETWQTYDAGGVIIIINGTVFFRATDAAGNVSEVTSYRVTNIDKEAPSAPVASADVTATTNGNVLVS